VARDGMIVLKKLLRRKDLAPIAIIAMVSEDVDIRDRENTIWGIFTRFDCERDVLFTAQELIGATAVYGGIMGIDATWKRGYPDPLRMNDDVRQRVDEQWERIWHHHG
jgi:4-hydroxy-3-polyprenylbenzoate decarboxylase